MRGSLGSAFSWLTVIAIVAALPLTGCGSDGLSRAEWTEKMNALCKQYREDTLKRNRDMVEEFSTGDFEDDPLTRYVQHWEQEQHRAQAFLARLRDIGPPAGDERTFRLLVDGNEEAMDEMAQFTDALRARDAAEVDRVLESSNVTLARMSARLRDLDLVECGRFFAEELR